jgi:hypothetical protein
VRLNANNTDAHEFRKFEICRQLNKEGKEFFTECVLINGKRCDILVIDDLLIIEILVTEKVQDFEIKRKNYFPEIFDIIAIEALKIYEPDMIH